MDSAIIILIEISESIPANKEGLRNGKRAWWVTGKGMRDSEKVNTRINPKPSQKRKSKIR